MTDSYHAGLYQERKRNVLISKSCKPPTFRSARDAGCHMECLNFLTHTPLAWSRHASSCQKRVLSTNWRAAQKGEYCPDGARLSCHVPSPRFRYDAQRGGGRGGVLAGGCHARLRVGPSGFGCGRARSLGVEVYLVGRGRSFLIVLFFFFLIITSTTTTTTIRCGVEIENSFRWSDLERHIPFVRSSVLSQCTSLALPQLSPPSSSSSPPPPSAPSLPPSPSPTSNAAGPQENQT